MYTQQSQRIEVIVRKEGGNGEKNNRETNSDEVSSNNNKTSISNKTKRFAIVNAAHTFALTKQFANATINYYVGGLGLKYGDEAYQEQVERNVEILQDVSGFATSTIMGATYGAAGGPLGIVLGGLFGAASNAISTGYKYLTRQRDFSYKVFKENNSIEYRRARASINLTTGRLR